MRIFINTEPDKLNIVGSTGRQGISRHGQSAALYLFPKEMANRMGNSGTGLLVRAANAPYDGNGLSIFRHF